MDNKISFNGTFLINYKRTIPGIKEGFEKSIGNKKIQIFQNFQDDKNSVLYILKDSRDFNAAHFIDKNELKFKYYPNINTKSGFDNEKPEEVIEYIDKNKPTLIEKLSELKDFIALNRTKNRARVRKSRLRSILNTFNVEIYKKPTRNSMGIADITDGKTRALISPENKSGTTFVRITKNKRNEYYAVDKNGTILKEFTDGKGFLRFKQEFEQSVKYHLHQD